MGLISAKIYYRTAALVFVSMSFFVDAQAQEPMWRVTNSLPGKVTPRYDNTSSPFPVELEKTKEFINQQSIKEEPEISEEELARLVEMQKAGEEARRVSFLLKRLRSIVSSDELLVADIGTVSVEAFVDTQNEKKALVQNRWVSEGQTIKVPAKGAESFFELLDELKQLDPKLAETIRLDMEDRLAQGNDLSLEIKTIGEDYVELVTPDGYPYVIYFSPADW